MSILDVFQLQNIIFVHVKQAAMVYSVNNRKRDPFRVGPIKIKNTLTFVCLNDGKKCYSSKHNLSHKK